MRSETICPVAVHGRSGVDGEHDPIEIVRADQAEAVFDQMPITLLTPIERVVRRLRGAARDPLLDGNQIVEESTSELREMRHTTF